MLRDHRYMVCEMNTSTLAIFCIFILCITSDPCAPKAAPLSPDVAAAPIGKIPAEIVERNVFRAAFVRAVPWAFRNRHGKYVGFEIDVAKQLASDMGVRHVGFPTTFGSIIPALIARRFDAIVSSMAVTPHRRATVVFTDPYVPKGAFGESVVANRGVKANISDLKSLNQSEIVIATRRHSQSAVIALETFPNAKHQNYLSHARAIEVVLLGKAHVAVGPEPHPTLWSLENPRELYMPFGEKTLTGGINAIAVRFNDRYLLDYLNQWIRARKEDGWLTERFRYWFRSTKWYDEMISPPGRLKYYE